jgi:hypothetical protein
MCSLLFKFLRLTSTLITAKTVSLLSFRGRRGLPKTGLKSQNGILSSFVSAPQRARASRFSYRSSRYAAEEKCSSTAIT